MADKKSARQLTNELEKLKKKMYRQGLHGKLGEEASEKGQSMVKSITNAIRQRAAEEGNEKKVIEGVTEHIKDKKINARIPGATDHIKTARQSVPGTSKKIDTKEIAKFTSEDKFARKQAALAKRAAKRDAMKRIAKKGAQSGLKSIGKKIASVIPFGGTLASMAMGEDAQAATESALPLALQPSKIGDQEVKRPFAESLAEVRKLERLGKITPELARKRLEQLKGER